MKGRDASPRASVARVRWSLLRSRCSPSTAIPLENTKAAPEKRLLIILLGALFFGLSLYLPFVPVHDNVAQIVCKWAVNIDFFIGGIVLIYTGVRGLRNQVARALQALGRGL